MNLIFSKVRLSTVRKVEERRQRRVVAVQRVMVSGQQRKKVGSKPVSVRGTGRGNRSWGYDIARSLSSLQEAQVGEGLGNSAKVFRTNADLKTSQRCS